MKLVDGPLAGKELPEFRGRQILFPFVRENETKDDCELGDWAYDCDGRFLGETVRTTTMNADAFRDTMEWLWRDYEP